MTKLLYIANVRLPTDNAHGVQIMKTCEALADEGAHVTLVRPTRRNTYKGDPFDVYHTKRNFRIVTIPSLDTLSWGRFGFWLQNITFGACVFMWLLFKRYDVIYSRDELPLYIASFVARYSIWESHTGRYNALIKKLLHRIYGLVVITQGLKDFYTERGFLKNTVVAPDGVALEDFTHPESKEVVRARLGLPLEALVAMYIGRLDTWKGVATFCEASKFLPDVVCVVIGGEPQEVQALSAQYPKMRFLGFRPYEELPDNQTAADVLILPNTAKDEISVRFTSPLKLFTYMASGRPIVCSDLPSLREILDEDSAFWFTPDSPEECARAIGEAFAGGEAARAKARAAYERVLAFTWRGRAKTILAQIAPRTLAR